MAFTLVTLSWKAPFSLFVFAAWDPETIPSPELLLLKFADEMVLIDLCPSAANPSFVIPSLKVPSGRPRPHN